MTSIEVGCRVVDKDGFTGTVRYIGPVAISKSADTQYAGQYTRLDSCHSG